MINAATLANLRRKSAYVDSVQLLPDGTPLFSWIDLSLTELCNRSHGHPRACQFCPRYDPKFYPNQNLHMSLSLVDKIARELEQLDYKGSVVLCGYGEPLLHPDVVEVVSILKSSGARVEIVTNGDLLGEKRIGELTAAGIDYFVVSMYDGPEQVERFMRAFEVAGVAHTHYALRDRWHTEEDHFGLKLTNRGGTIEVGKQDPIDARKPCHYLAYQLTIDWNGDVLLCPQDWNKRRKFGNVAADKLIDVWTDKRLHKQRMGLIAGHRSQHPCVVCNTDGTLHGYNHVPCWSK